MASLSFVEVADLVEASFQVMAAATADSSYQKDLEVAAVVLVSIAAASLQVHSSNLP